MTDADIGGTTRLWLRLARLKFYPMAWFAYSVGALLGAGGSAGFSAAPYWLGYGALFCLTLATVLVNELVDRETDRRNTNFGMFTGGSRVLVDDLLPADAVTRGAWVAGLLVLTFAGVALVMMPEPSAQAAAVLAVMAVLCLGYTLPPLRLSYRTLGELDVAVTHAPGMILAGHTLMGGSLADPAPWLLSLPLALSILPSIILSGIPDAEADAAAGKRTIAVRFGIPAAYLLAGLFTLLALATAALVAAAPVGVACLNWLLLPAIPHAVLLLYLLRRAFRSRRFGGRIDTLMAVSLTYIAPFVLVPFLWLL